MNNTGLHGVYENRKASVFLLSWVSCGLCVLATIILQVSACQLQKNSVEHHSHSARERESVSQQSVCLVTSFGGSVIWHPVRLSHSQVHLAAFWKCFKTKEKNLNQINKGKGMKVSEEALSKISSHFFNHVKKRSFHLHESTIWG